MSPPKQRILGHALPSRTLVLLAVVTILFTSSLLYSFGSRTPWTVSSFNAVGGLESEAPLIDIVPLRNDQDRQSSLLRVWHVPGADGLSYNGVCTPDGRCSGSDATVGSLGAFFLLADNPSLARVLRVRLIGPAVMALGLERTSVLPDELAARVRDTTSSSSSEVCVFVARYYLPLPGTYNLSIIATYGDSDFSAALADDQGMKALCIIPASAGEQVLEPFSVYRAGPSDGLIGNIADSLVHGSSDRFSFSHIYRGLNAGCGPQEPLLSPFLPKIFWRVDPEYMGFVTAASQGAGASFMFAPSAGTPQNKRPVADYAFAHGRFLNRSCCRGYLTAAAAASREWAERPPGDYAYKMCFVGDSHMRYLYNDVLLALLGGADYNVEFPKQARQEPLFRFVNVRFDSDLDDALSVVAYECAVVFANFGQWLLGWPGDRPWTVAEYAREVDDALHRLKAALTYPDRVGPDRPLNQSLYWLLQEPCPQSEVFVCPPSDWRTDPWTRAYNEKAAQVADMHGVRVLDVFSIYEAVQELTTDGCHYISPMTSAAVDAILGELWPACVESGCEGTDEGQGN